MVSPAGTVNNKANAAALAFVRSFNILLKYSRLYGQEHARTASQFDSTWKELCEAQSQNVATGLMLGAAEGQLLLDGTSLGSGTAERSLAQLMKTAGVASLYFSPATSPEDFRKLVNVLVTSGKSSSALSEAWKPMADGAIRLNQVRFVAENGEGEAFSLASHLASQALAEQSPEMQAWLRDPHKLLQMIAAAEGASRVTGSFPAPGTVPGTPTISPGPAAPAQESDVMEVIRMLTQWGGEPSGAGAGKITGAVAQLPEAAQHEFRHALQEVAQLSHSDPSKPLLLQVAEHLAIRFALDRFERGEVRVNAVREMLGRMEREMESLRSVLSAHENMLGRAGINVESHADILDRQFWASVPEKGKRSVLLSPDAWCIPPRNVEQYVRELLERQESSLAERILANYAEGIVSSEIEGRNKSATGLCYLAALYASFPQLLQQVVQILGDQLTKESDPELQRAFSAAFVRLSQEAVSRRDFSSVQQAVAAVDSIEKQLPELALQLRPRLGLHDRLPEFVSEAMACAQPAPELLDILRCIPQAASQKFIQQFETCARRDSCERIISVMEQLGPAAVQHLRDQLRTQPAPEAAIAVGLLSRLDARGLEHSLPQRIASWPRAYQDVAIRQLAAGAAPGRGHLLLKLMDHVDAALLPELVDEIGMTEERSSTTRLMSLAFDDAPGENGGYLRVKAIEALGRMHESKAGEHLRMMVAARHLLHWKHPREIRVASAQSLAMIDPQTARAFLAGKGFTPRELALGPLLPLAEAPWTRQRRYPRILPPHEVSGTVSTAKRSVHLQVKRMSLGGGLAQADGVAVCGTPADLELQSGLNHIRAQVWVRNDSFQPHSVSFEIIRIELEERSKLRRLLAGESWALPAHLLHIPLASSLRAALR